jgi:hypothetical protein
MFSDPLPGCVNQEIMNGNTLGVRGSGNPIECRVPTMLSDLQEPGQSGNNN